MAWIYQDKNRDLLDEFLLQELGSFILQEDGGKIVLDQSRAHFGYGVKKSTSYWTNYFINI